MHGILCAAAVVAVWLLTAPAALAHQGNPNFISHVRSVTPSTPGLTVDVLNRDDRLEIKNQSGRTVIVRGYRDEPYVRIRADGTVEVNVRSPSTYLNEERYGNVKLPAGADEDARPRWRLQDRTGRFQFHDHRMHWMAKSRPPQVRDPGRRTKIFDWKVPVSVGARRGDIAGELFWVPRPSVGPPLAAIVILTLVVLGGGGLVLVVRRRRARGDGTAPETVKEAW